MQPLTFSEAVNKISE